MTVQDGMRPRVLLATTTSWLSFSRIPRLFALAGCDIDVISPPEALVARRKFVDKRIPVSGGVEAIGPALLDHLSRVVEPYAWVVIGDDELFRWVAQHGDAAVDSWFPSDRRPEAIAFFASKLSFMERCAENGFSIAPYRRCTSIAQADAAAAEFGFPLIVKTPESVGGSGVTRADTAEDFKALVSSLSGEFAVQQFAAGRQIIAEILFDRGRPRCWMTSELINRWPRSLGPCSVRRLIDVPNMDDVIRRVGKLTQFHGFASIDAILPHDGGPPMLSEMNCRPTTGYHFNGRVRLEFARAISEMLAGTPVADYAPLAAPGSDAALFPEAFYYLSAKPAELSRWRYAIGSLRRVPVDDPDYLVHVVKGFGHHVAGQLRKGLSERRK